MSGILCLLFLRNTKPVLISIILGSGGGSRALFPKVAKVMGKNPIVAVIFAVSHNRSFLNQFESNNLLWPKNYNFHKKTFFPFWSLGTDEMHEN